jgi:phage terminase large subunit-like protein
MAPAMKTFEERVLNERLVHGDNPLLTWAVSNVVPDIDAAGNSKPNKERARERIDPVVAAIMAIGATTLDVSSGPSVYERRGLLVL